MSRAAARGPDFDGIGMVRKTNLDCAALGRPRPGVPAARQRATTAGTGIPQRLPNPAEAIPRRADTAATNSGVEELRLP